MEGERPAYEGTGIVHAERIASTVIPRLLASLASSRVATEGLAADASSLAQLLTAGQFVEAAELIERARMRIASPGLLLAELFERSARCLGDLWSEDRCSEVDVTIALCHLHGAARRVASAYLPVPRASDAPRVALVATQPGEPHLLCAALNAELLRQRGWQICCEFPDSDDALNDLVSETWFDALDLSLSPALCRDHWQPRVADTIRSARLASRNPDLVVVVSGRAFAEQPEVAFAVGADAAVGSALRAEQVILGSLPTRTPQHTASVTRS
jgi:hypothetical protein